MKLFPFTIARHAEIRAWKRLGWPLHLLRRKATLALWNGKRVVMGSREFQIQHRGVIYAFKLINRETGHLMLVTLWHRKHNGPRPYEREA